MAKAQPQPEESNLPAVVDTTEDITFAEEAPSTPRWSHNPDIFSEDDIIYPRLKLLQGLSPEVNQEGSQARPGQWFITGQVNGTKNITIIPVAYGLSRRFSVGPDREHQTLLCRSVDGITGTILVEDPGYGEYGGACATCPMSQWQEDPVTKKRMLACQPSYNYVAYVPDFGLVTLSLSKTATATAKSINGYLKLRGFGRLAVELGSMQKSGDGKMYYSPTLQVAKVAPEVFEEAQGLM